jgi:hypothetical protein
MSVFFATAVLALSLLPGATPEPLQWETSYGKALEATRSDARPLLVVLDKPATADARLEPALLSPGQDAAKQLELLRSYELCHVDATTDYGQKVAEAFGAKAFPFVAVIDKTGSVILYSKAGKAGSDEWSKMLTAHKSGDRSTAVSRVTYKPVSSGSTMFQSPSNGMIMGTSNCPNCQRRSY